MRGRREAWTGDSPEESVGAIAEGDARDAVAARVGMSHDTLAKAIEVVEAAEENPEEFGPVVAEMNETRRGGRRLRRPACGRMM